MTTKFDPRRIDAFIRRAVDAIESIANSLKNKPQEMFFIQNIYGPDLDPTKIYQETKALLDKHNAPTLTPDPPIVEEVRRQQQAMASPSMDLPAYWNVNFTEDGPPDRADGEASITRDGLTIHLPSSAFPDVIDSIIARGGPISARISLHHSRPV